MLEWRAFLAANWGIHSVKNVPSQHSCTPKRKIHTALPERCSGCLFLSGSPSIRGIELLSNFNDSRHRFSAQTSSVVGLQLSLHTEQGLLHNSFFFFVLPFLNSVSPTLERRLAARDVRDAAQGTRRIVWSEAAVPPAVTNTRRTRTQFSRALRPNNCTERERTDARAGENGRARS